MKVERRDLDLGKLTAILQRISEHLSDQEHADLQAALDTLAVLTTEIGSKGASIQRLRRMLFGPRTEKTDIS
jgi:transposase